MGVKRNLDSAGMSEPNDNITEDEAALYDRQIRLWGVDCQKRIRETRVLMIGLNGVGVEVAKNLALSGVKCITIMDETPVKPSDYSAQFFVVGSEGQNRAAASKAAIQELNPNVKITVDEEKVESKNAKYLSEFDLVCATDLPLNQLLRLNRLCREHKVNFYCADTWGMYGYCFFDLQTHSYSSIMPSTTSIIPLPTSASIPVADNVVDPSLTLPSGSRASESGEVTIFDGPDTILSPASNSDDEITIIYEGPARILIDAQGKLRKEKPLINRMEYCPLGLALGAKVEDGLHKKINKVFILQHIMNNYREQHGQFPSPENREAALAELKKIRTTVTKNLKYDEAKITDDMLSNVFGELSPVCSAIGGILANDIVTAISRKGLPVHNFFLFNGEDCMGCVETVLMKE